MSIAVLSTIPTDTSSSLADIMITLAVLLGLLLIGVVVSVVIRRRLLADDDGDAAGFTLQELREMRMDGRLTEEEYEAARTAMIGRIRSSGAEQPTSPSERG